MSISIRGLCLEFDYAHWVKEIRETNFKYLDLFAGGREKPPIFFFGDPKGAVAATIGVNPSATEFDLTRGWTDQYFKPNFLINRCQNYFNNPAGARPHEWFDVWKDFLKNIGCAYTNSPKAIHLDFSPRATLSMGALQKLSKQHQELFIDLIRTDMTYLINQIRAYPQINYLYLAGSATKRFYCIDLLKREANRLGIELEPKVPFEREGPGSFGLYMIDVGDKKPRYLFFCSTSPSSRTKIKPHPLVARGKWLKTKHPEFIPNNSPSH